MQEENLKLNWPVIKGIIMESSRHIRTIHAHMKKAIAAQDRNLKFAFAPESCEKWYVMITNLKGGSDEYVFTDENEANGTGRSDGTGEFIFTLEIPAEFPAKPPKFKAITPTGLFTVGEYICIHIGTYHSQNYLPGIGLYGFVKQIEGGMTYWQELKHGLGIREDHARTNKAAFARASRQYNATHHPDIVALLYSHYDDYSRDWPAANVNDGTQL